MFLLPMMGFACQTEETLVKIVPQAEAPSEYSLSEEESWQSDVEVDVNLVVLEDELNQVLSELRQYNAGFVMTSHQEVMNYADSHCPSAYVVDGNSFWYGACQSEQGMVYDGYLFTNHYHELDFFGDGGTWDVSVVSGSTSMLYPTQERVHWAGDAYFAQGYNIDGHPVYFSLLNGSFLDQAQTGWLSEGYQNNLMLYGIHFDFSGLQGNGFYVEGSMNVQGEELAAIGFNELLSYPTEIGYPCQEEPMGSISLRDSEGRWFNLEFDIAEDWSMSGRCDGCGTLFFEGDTIGEICIDNSNLMEWEGEAPWSLQ